MRRISDLIGEQLKWVQPGALKMHYELRAADELAASLHFRSSFGSFATAESADGCWTFKRVGFWQTGVTVRHCGGNDDIAIFRNNTWSGGGTLEFPDGGRILASTNFWQTRFEFKTESGETLVEFETGGLIHISAIVEIKPGAVAMPELPLIVMLGWYLVVMMRMDSAASVVIAG
jgi:hypothetical protein